MLKDHPVHTTLPCQDRDRAKAFYDKATSVAQTGPARAAWFKDSEGNLLGLLQLPRQ